MVWLSYDEAVPRGGVHPATAVMIVDDPINKSKYPALENCIFVTDFLPTYQIMSAAIDGDINAFANMYREQLFTTGEEMMVLILATSVMKNKDIIVFASPELADHNILQHISEAMVNKYGVLPQFFGSGIPTQIVNNQQFMNLWVDCYKHNIISFSDLIGTLSSIQFNGCLIWNPEAVMKMTYEVKPMIHESMLANRDPLQVYTEYFNNLIQTTRQYNTGDSHKKVSPLFVDNNLG
jgi:hypothetical protein